MAHPNSELIHLMRLRDLLRSAIDTFPGANIAPPTGIEIGADLTATAAKVEALSIVALSHYEEREGERVKRKVG